MKKNHLRINAIEIPAADWEVNVTGPMGLTIRQKGAPCLFWRIMQRIVLGFRWTRILPND